MQKGAPKPSQHKTHRSFAKGLQRPNLVNLPISQGSSKVSLSQRLVSIKLVSCNHIFKRQRKLCRETSISYTFVSTKHAYLLASERLHREYPSALSRSIFKNKNEKNRPPFPQGTEKVSEGPKNGLRLNAVI